MSSVIIVVGGLSPSGKTRNRAICRTPGFLWVIFVESSDKETSGMNANRLLGLDAIINLVLGLLLVIFPVGIMEWLGVPIPESNFYANILGAVLFGIGIALLIKIFGKKIGSSGLGVGGAISVNLCGAVVLAVWLIFGSLTIPIRGRLFLWSLVILITSVSMLELIYIWKRRRGDVH